MSGSSQSPTREQIAGALRDHGLDKVISAEEDLNLAADYLANMGFMGMDGVNRFLFLTAHAPASAGHHLAYAGGLFVHSFNVTRRLLQQTELLKVQWPYWRSPYLVGMCHDLCKHDAYEPDPDNAGRFRKKRVVIPGHGLKSCAMLAALADLFCHGQFVTEAEHAAIAYHMGAWGICKEYSTEDLDAALKKYPLEIIATHTADMLASQYDECTVELGRTDA